jgi:hypothetical protein
MRILRPRPPNNSLKLTRRAGRLGMLILPARFAQGCVWDCPLPPGSLARGR